MSNQISGRVGGITDERLAQLVGDTCQLGSADGSDVVFGPQDYFELWAMLQELQQWRSGELQREVANA